MKLALRQTNPPGVYLKNASRSVRSSSAKAAMRAAAYAGGVISQDVMEIIGYDELARSFAKPTLLEDTEHRVAAGALSKHKAARILDQGGTIKPVTVQMLAIPLSPMAKNQWPRDLPKEQLVLIKPRGTPLLVDREKAKKGQIEAHYVLKPQVTISPRHYIAWSAEKVKRELPKMFGEELRAGLNRALKESQSG